MTAWTDAWMDTQHHDTLGSFRSQKSTVVKPSVQMELGYERAEGTEDFVLVLTHPIKALVKIFTTLSGKITPHQN